MVNPFNTLSELKTRKETIGYFSLPALQKSGFANIHRLPFSIKILLENVLRHCDAKIATEDHVRAIANWTPQQKASKEIPFMPARVLLQDFTGIPCVCDLAALREAVKKMGGDTRKINPLIPVDLVIDHSVQVDFFGSAGAFERNVQKEYERNKERYLFLKWAQQAFDQLRVVPPGTGICHQVNLEYFGKVVQSKKLDGKRIAFPDTLVGADSHTTMINSLGILGWGVGGIEAEACMLGQPMFILIPEVVGFKFFGELKEGATATDLVLTVTQMLRRKGVVGKFVEYFGPGLSQLKLPDRATVANMSPEYGATVGFFPVDAETLLYLRQTNRDPELIGLVEAYSKTQGLFRTNETQDPLFSDLLELDLGSVEPSLAGPRRPQDRVPMKAMKKSFEENLKKEYGKESRDSVEVELNGKKTAVQDGSVVISAITSCTNTSNPTVMVAAGLLAKKAVEHDLRVSPTVKTSLAPGSRVVTDYLRDAGLLTFLEKLGFSLVGYGCTTCIGNSGPLSTPIAEAIKDQNLVTAAVLSGNRNFDGRINPLAKMAYLASPPLVVAFALAGRVDIDLEHEPVGVNQKGESIYLREIWPSQDEVQSSIQRTLRPTLFKERYAHLYDGESSWREMKVSGSDSYAWDNNSTYIHPPTFLEDFTLDPRAPKDIHGARILVLLGDSVTTDHISPAGSIAEESPAGKYLIEHGVRPLDFNTYGARRGNHEVMIRGTFANNRLKNLMVPQKEGPWTCYLPSGEILFIYDAAMKYKALKTPLLVIAGKEYGAGSSRDWAAKGANLLGVKAVIAESYERIHRSNLVGMGVLPLEFKEGESAKSLGLTGFEIFEITGIENNLSPRKEITVNFTGKDGQPGGFKAIARLDGPIDVEYYRNGGILQTVLRQILARS